MRLRFRQELDRKLLLKIEAVVWLPFTFWEYWGRSGLRSTRDRLRGGCWGCCWLYKGWVWQLGHFLLLAGTWGTLKTGSLLKETLLCKSRPPLEAEAGGGFLLGEQPEKLAFRRPYLGGLALASEVSLHLLGSVGKCILARQGRLKNWLSPIARCLCFTRCKYKNLGSTSSKRPRASAAHVRHSCSDTGYTATLPGF